MEKDQLHILDSNIAEAGSQRLYIFFSHKHLYTSTSPPQVVLLLLLLLKFYSLPPPSSSSSSNSSPHSPQNTHDDSTPPPRPSHPTPPPPNHISPPESPLSVISYTKISHPPLATISSHPNSTIPSDTKTGFRFFCFHAKLFRKAFRGGWDYIDRNLVRCRFRGFGGRDRSGNRDCRWSSFRRGLVDRSIRRRCFGRVGLRGGRRSGFGGLLCGSCCWASRRVRSRRGLDLRRGR